MGIVWSRYAVEFILSSLFLIPLLLGRKNFFFFGWMRVRAGEAKEIEALQALPESLAWSYFSLGRGDTNAIAHMVSLPIISSPVC